jgi:hypothetical protein
VTPLGHSITGATIGVLAVPSAWRPWAKTAVVVTYAVLANVPDFWLPHWGHERYDVSHSIFVNGAIIVALALPLLASSRFRRHKGACWVVLGAAAAWLSHLLLDMFYNHNRGLAMFWPLSGARLSLAIPWLGALGGHFNRFDAHTVRVLLIELASFGSLFALALAGRWAYARYRNRGRLFNEGAP